MFCNRHGGLAAAPYNVYPVRDGHVAVIGVNDKHWRNVLQAIGRTDLDGDPRFAEKTNRVFQIEAVDALLEEWTSRHTKAEVLDIFGRFKVPVAPVRDLVEVTHDPHMHERGMLQWIDHPQFGHIVVPESPIRLHGVDTLERTPSPRLSEHSHEILAQKLKMEPAEIEKLEAEGVIGKPEAPQ